MNPGMTEKRFWNTVRFSLIAEFVIAAIAAGWKPWEEKS